MFFTVYRLTNYNPYNLFVNAGQAVFILPEERTTGLGCIPDGTVQQSTMSVLLWIVLVLLQQYGEEVPSAVLAVLQMLLVYYILGMHLERVTLVVICLL